MTVLAAWTQRMAASCSGWRRRELRQLVVERRNEGSIGQHAPSISGLQRWSRTVGATGHPRPRGGRRAAAASRVLMASFDAARAAGVHLTDQRATSAADSSVEASWPTRWAIRFAATGAAAVRSWRGQLRRHATTAEQQLPPEDVNGPSASRRRTADATAAGQRRT